MSASAMDRVTVIQPGQTYVGKQGFTYGAGASAETVGAKDICMNVLPMPRGAGPRCITIRASRRFLSARGRMRGLLRRQLEHRALMRAGEQIFIPADVPHAPCNESGARCTWLVVHSSGSDQDGIVLMPELDKHLAERLGATA